MREEDTLHATLCDDRLAVERVATLCGVEHTWLVARAQEGLLPGVVAEEEVWRCTPGLIQRVRRMRRIEADFEAVPELAALVADLLDELDSLRGGREGRGGA
ncbi:MAG: MerR family transcriptional regulator [Zoogloeaceae bacterium]|nr:MerR family transcriptional regulator [Zoogloeaceae bacterium]